MATARSAPNLNIPRDSVARRLDAAVDAFLSQARFSDETRRSYRKTLDALTTVLEAAGAEPTAAAIEVAVRLRWGTVAPATWTATRRRSARSSATPAAMGCSTSSTLTGPPA